MIVDRDLSLDSDAYICVPLDTVVSVARAAYYITRTIRML